MFLFIHHDIFVPYVIEVLRQAVFDDSYTTYSIFGLKKGTHLYLKSYHFGVFLGRFLGLCAGWLVAWLAGWLLAWMAGWLGGCWLG